MAYSEAQKINLIKTFLKKINFSGDMGETVSSEISNKLIDKLKPEYKDSFNEVIQKKIDELLDKTADVYLLLLDDEDIDFLLEFSNNKVASKLFNTNIQSEIRKIVYSWQMDFSQSLSQMFNSDGGSFDKQ